MTMDCVVWKHLKHKRLFFRKEGREILKYFGMIALTLINSTDVSHIVPNVMHLCDRFNGA